MWAEIDKIVAKFRNKPAAVNSLPRKLFADCDEAALTFLEEKGILSISESDVKMVDGFFDCPNCVHFERRSPWDFDYCHGYNKGLSGLQAGYGKFCALFKSRILEAVKKHES